jgi:hypothetical protein
MARNALSRPEVSASLKGDEGAPKLFDPDGPGESLVFKLVLAVSADALVAFVRGLLQLAETLGGPSLDKPFVNTAAASSLLEILRKWPTPGDISKGGHPHPNCLPLSETLILSQLSAAALEVRRSIEAARQVPPANSTPANPPTAGKPNLPEPTITASAPTDAFIIWAAGELNNGNYLGLTHFFSDRLDRLVSKVQRANDGGFTVSSIRNACRGNPSDPDALPSRDPERPLFVAMLRYILASVTQCGLFWEDTFPSPDDPEVSRSPELAPIAAAAAEASRQLAEIGGLVDFFSDLVSYFHHEDQGHGRDSGRKAVARAMLNTTQAALQFAGAPVRPCNPDLFLEEVDGVRQLRVTPLSVRETSTMSQRLERASRFHVNRLARGMRIRQSTERKRERERNDRDDARGPPKKRKNKLTTRSKLISKYINDNKAAISASGVCWSFNNENGCQLQVANGKCSHGLHSCVVLGCQGNHSLWDADDTTCPEGAKLSPKLTKWSGPPVPAHHSAFPAREHSTLRHSPPQSAPRHPPASHASSTPLPASQIPPQGFTRHLKVSPAAAFRALVVRPSRAHGDLPACWPDLPFPARRECAEGRPSLPGSIIAQLQSLISITLNHKFRLNIDILSSSAEPLLNTGGFLPDPPRGWSCLWLPNSQHTLTCCRLAIELRTSGLFIGPEPSSQPNTEEWAESIAPYAIWSVPIHLPSSAPLRATLYDASLPPGPDGKLRIGNFMPSRSSAPWATDAFPLTPVKWFDRAWPSLPPPPFPLLEARLLPMPPEPLPAVLPTSSGDRPLPSWLKPCEPVDPTLNNL